MVDMVFDKLHF